VSDRRKAALLDRALGTLFRKLEGRDVPEHIRATVDQLDKAQPVAPKQRA
jgi:hypothetical protein